MPRLSSRQARTRDVLKTFIEHHRERLKRLLRRKNKAQRALAQAGVTLEDGEQLMDPLVDAESITMASISTGFDSSISSNSSITSETTSDNWSDLLGSDWRGSSNSSASSSTSFSDSEDDTDTMPDLYPAGYPDSDDDSDSDSSSDSTSNSGDDADDEDDWDMDEAGPDLTRVRPNYPLDWVRHNLDKMHDQRYEQPRNTFPRGPAFLRHVLGTMKNTRPDLFRQELRVSPRTFDRLVANSRSTPSSPTIPIILVW
ncbi:hypothetical protein B0H14DRAFT_3482800 [Mycena olivaceomarginata]|nr:hypothetical protein B0H14DRAFT_3482800 [Mycena olivaceomarginata]